MDKKKEITIKCKDGFELSAVLYKPEETKAAIMIAPATGIKKTFYNSFATYLSENEYGVICFENRGIGKSKKGSINNGNASLINWGKLDMTAVFEELKIQFPNTTYHIIGHSAGGQLFGLMDNALEINSVFNFAASSGSLKNMSFGFYLQAVFFLNIFIPISNLLFGYTKSQWVGMGEPLPKKVAAQWKKWCNGEGYIKVDLDKNIKEHFYNEINIPTSWLHATDDNIANLENVKDMIRVFPNIQAEIKTLNPKEFGCKNIGHMKFFSSKCKDLWPMTLNWLERKSD